MSKLCTNNSGYILTAAAGEPVKATRPLAPGEAVLSQDPLITVHPIDGACLMGKPVRDWVAMLLQLEAAIQTGAKQWILPPEKTPGGDWSHMDMAKDQEKNPAGNGWRPYRAPKPNAVTVAKPDRASDGGGVDAELAAAGWRPYKA